MTTTIPTRTVQIPARDDHDGHASMRVTLPWVCPVCGGPRGEPRRGISYDGSRRLECDTWKNPCGHVQLYSEDRREASGYRTEISPNQVSHLIDPKGRCVTCGRSHDDWDVEEPKTSCGHTDGPCRICDNMYPEPDDDPEKD